MIVLDTETTGLLKPSASDIDEQPRITEIYACKVDRDFNFISEINTLVNPMVPIPEDVVEMTGITDEMVANAPTFPLIYDELCDFFLGEEIAVAHNASYDMNVIRWELTRYGKEIHFPWPRRHICTVEDSFVIKNKRLNLSKLHEMATGRPHDQGAHRAKHDVMALVRCFNWLVEEGYTKL